MQKAKVSTAFTIAQNDPGLLICPTSYPDTTLYVLTSETQERVVVFRDIRSGREFSGQLAARRAALLLVGADGKLIASYHWSPVSPNEK
jgi:hypothetical protein